MRYFFTVLRYIAIRCFHYIYRNQINFSIFAFILNFTYENQNYTHAHMSVWRPLIRVEMSQACNFWTYYCCMIGDEWKRHSLDRRRKSCDILRYTFRIAIRYKFLVYCDISIYCDTLLKNGNWHIIAISLLIQSWNFAHRHGILVIW